MKCFSESITFKKRLNDIRGMALTNWNMASLYTEQGLLEKALPLAETFVQWEEHIGHPDAVADRAAVEQLRARIASGEGRGEDAA